MLTDRGLDAAVSALAARCPVPVAVDVDLPHRAGPGIEAIAYFVVAEALTNVAKHVRSDARVADRRVPAATGWSSRSSTTAAVGPTRPAAASAGLRDRVRAVDGDLNLASPPGHGTTLRVELPCEQ